MKQLRTDADRTTFRHRAVGKLTLVLSVWFAITICAVLALTYDMPTLTKALLCASIAVGPGGLATAVLELRREWLDLELTPERNLLEMAPMLVGFVVAVVVYLIL